jgi:transposase
MILNEHISKKSIMREYNVATKTQRQWVHKYQTEGISGLVSKRKIRDKIPTNQEEESVESLKHEILMLKLEIERLKRGYNLTFAVEYQKNGLYGLFSPFSPL